MQLLLLLLNLLMLILMLLIQKDVYISIPWLENIHTNGYSVNVCNTKIRTYEAYFKKNPISLKDSKGSKHDTIILLQIGKGKCLERQIL